MWNNYFKLPFQLVEIKVLDNECHMVFDFLQNWMSDCEKCIVLSENNQQIVVDILNQNKKSANDFTFTYDSSTGFVLLNDTPLLRIRGWGYLTGTGGCNLSSEKASNIQNSLAEYIINQLNYRV